jgi:hypothetical protein
MFSNRACKREKSKIDKNGKPMLIACQQRQQLELEQKTFHT